MTTPLGIIRRPVFRGFVSAIKEQIVFGRALAIVTAQGALSYYGKNTLPISGIDIVGGNGTPGQLIERVLNNPGEVRPRYPINAPSNSLDDGSSLLRYAYLARKNLFGGPRGRVNPYTVLKALARYDFGKIFTAPTGEVVFQGRDYRNNRINRSSHLGFIGPDASIKATSIKTTLEDRFIINTFESNWSDIRDANYDLIPAGGEWQVEIPSASDYSVLVSLPDDVDQWAKNGIWPTPLDYSFYAATGVIGTLVPTGPDRPERISFDISERGFFSARLNVRNTSGGNGILIVRGPWSIPVERVTGAGVAVSVRTAASLASRGIYGERELKVDPQAFVDSAGVFAWASVIVQESAYPRPVWEVTIECARNPESMALALSARPGALVRLTAPELGQTSTPCWIEAYSARMRQNSYELVLSLTEALPLY